MTPATAVSYTMLAVAMVVALRGGSSLVLSAMASGAHGALTLWGSERR